MAKDWSLFPLDLGRKRRNIYPWLAKFKHIYSLADWGDEKLFQGIKDAIEAEVPLETIEWKRNYGRASKNVVISPKFVRFEPEQVTASNGVKSMIGQPILHTFWIECSVSKLLKDLRKYNQHLQGVPCYM